MELQGREKPPGRVLTRRTAVAGVALLLLLSAAGGGLIVWWAISFHRNNNQLWMVPIGLVLLGTPIVAWVSVLASDTCRRPEIHLAAAPDGEEGNRVVDTEGGYQR